MLCDQNEKIEEATEETRLQEESNEEEVAMLCEKIDTVEYQNVMSLERLEDYMLREDIQMKKAKEYENNK